VGASTVKDICGKRAEIPGLCGRAMGDASVGERESKARKSKCALMGKEDNGRLSSPKSVRDLGWLRPTGLQQLISAPAAGLALGL
jgi:hypothetical protein